MNNLTVRELLERLLVLDRMGKGDYQLEVYPGYMLLDNQFIIDENLKAIQLDGDRS